jgi:type I restriction-modification system DNA methylase subunit
LKYLILFTIIVVNACQGVEMPRSEVRAYAYILSELLTKKGWTRNEVTVQQECQDIKEIKKSLDKKTPENIVQIAENTFYVIEAKNKRSKIDLALREAKEEYADIINKNSKARALFISGVAGNDKEGFLCRSMYYCNKKWLPITENGFETTGLLSKSQITRILHQKGPDLKDIEIDQNEFLRAAENINNILHSGAINKDYRARVMASLLLALAEGSEINVEENPHIMIQSINSRVDLMLRKHNKTEFARFIKIDLPSSEDNHVKFKKALVLTIQELLELNIRSAMRSGNDVLGKFYEVFLKYGNGAKEIGIVLTPRHLTQFAASVVGVSTQDIVYDPTCGTGGFLVSALDIVAKNEKSTKKLELFKKHGLYGVEQQDPVVALALVNMIFRGDGKNNIIEGDCFKKWLTVDNKDGVAAAKYTDSESNRRIPPVTRVLMNPPFSQKSSDEKEHRFVDQALCQMQDEGILFAVLPMSIMTKGGTLLSWRKNSLLKHNTLLGVVTFPEDIFYPIGVRTVGIFVKKGIPHKKSSRVFWAKISKDGFVKSKGKRLRSPKVDNELETIMPFISKVIAGTNQKFNEPRFYTTEAIDYNDEQLELVPEVYLDEGLTSIDSVVQAIDKVVRELFSFLIVSKDLNNPILGEFKKQKTTSLSTKRFNYRNFYPDDLFEISRGDYHVSSSLDDGTIPLISCKSVENGIEGYFDIDTGIHQNCLTIASDGSWPLTTFYQPYRFAAKDNVIICSPKDSLKMRTLLFISAQLNSQIWRFSYGRKAYLNKLSKIQISLPIKANGQIDEKSIESIVNSSPIWNDIQSIRAK